MNIYPVRIIRVSEVRYKEVVTQILLSFANFFVENNAFKRISNYCSRPQSTLFSKCLIKNTKR